ncbi:hypothetical protein D3C78_945330 [compost metagenome]
MQLRTGKKVVQLAAVRSELARQLGILKTGLITQAQEEPLGTLDTKQVDDLTAEVG